MTPAKLRDGRVVWPHGPDGKSMYSCPRCPCILASVGRLERHYLSNSCRESGSRERARRMGYTGIGSSWNLVRDAIPHVERRFIREIRKDFEDTHPGGVIWQGYVLWWAHLIAVSVSIDKEERVAMLRFVDGNPEVRDALDVLRGLSDEDQWGFEASVIEYVFRQMEELDAVLG